jgi:hypothetical protein
VLYDVDAYDNPNTVLAAFIEARVQDVDAQVEGCGIIRALLSNYPLAEMARDVAAAFLCVLFVVAVALLIIGGGASAPHKRRRNTVAQMASLLRSSPLRPTDDPKCDQST